LRGHRWLWASVAFLLACAARVPPPELQADPAELLSRLEAAQEGVRSVRGRARVGISAPGRSGSTDAFLAAERPDRLRIEVLDFFGNVAATLASDGERFSLYDARAGALYRGEPTPENVSRLLPLPLAPGELVAILLGTTPVRPGAATAAERRDGRVLLVVGTGEATSELLLGAELAVEEARLPAAGAGPAYALEFGLFRHRGGRRFPTEIGLEAPSARARVTLGWKEDLEVNPPPEPGLFRLETPRGARVVDLGPGAPAPAVELPLRKGGE
jgi:hypothetical protein